jgi:hypothetical protein
MQEQGRFENKGHFVFGPFFSDMNMNERAIASMIEFAFIS